MSAPRLVIIESPYAGNIERNVSYARAAVRDCLMRGEAPIASHLLYTQPGILQDEIPAERQHGIDAGLAWGVVAHVTVVYTDLGISRGMVYGCANAERAGRPVEYRTISGWVGSDEVHLDYLKPRARQSVMKILKALLDAEWADSEPGVTDAEQITQGSRCSCRGTDDMCPCQNVRRP